MTALDTSRETLTAVVTEITRSSVVMRDTDGRQLRYAPGAGLRMYGVPFLRSALPGETFTFKGTLTRWSDWNCWHLSRPVLVQQGRFCPLDQLDAWPDIEKEHTP